GKDRGPVPVNCLQDVRDLESREQDHGGATHHREVLTGAEAIDVEKWNHSEEHLSTVDKIRHPDTTLPGVRHDVSVSQHHALRSPGGSSRVLEDGYVLAIR